MFNAFFALLRARGIHVSMGEWLTLLRALDGGLGEASLTRFYTLCRAILIKSEKDFDRFDEVFLEFFQGIRHSDELPEELRRWLQREDVPPPPQRGEEPLTDEEIRARLHELLEEQDAPHHGGSHWVGTGGTSPFGHSGQRSRGILVEGESNLHHALAVAGQRKYHDLREDEVLETRNFQVALRSLRRLSTRTEVPRTEFDVEASIHKTAAHGGLFHPVFERPRRNTVKLLLLMDSGGSMDIHLKLCAELFHAAHSVGHFRELKTFYFHNCIKGNLYTTPRIRPEDRVPTWRVLDNLDASYRVIIVGDAMMDPGELTDSYAYRDGRSRSGLDWLRELTRRFPHLIWLTPQDIAYWDDKPWGGKSIRMIGEIVEFRRLTPQGLQSALKLLIAG